MNKHAFERSLLGGIPRSEALSFFHRIKTAGWGEPPDESGALEGQFTAPIEQVIQKLTDVITAKFQLMLAYHIYAESMRGTSQHACAEVFLEHAEQERAAAEAYLKRAAVLGGGPVHLPEVLPPPASADPVGILMIMIRAEQEGIAAQRELKALVGEDNPLTFQIEQYMIEDQHHLDEAWQMLPQDVQHSPVLEAGGADPAVAGDSAGMEAPPELPGAEAEGELPEEEVPPPPAAASGAPPMEGAEGLPEEEAEPDPTLLEEGGDESDVASAKPPAGLNPRFTEEGNGEEDPAAEEAEEKPEPKPKADKPKEDKSKPKEEKKEPSEEKKEAFAIGLVNLLLKQAGMADDIIGGMDPNYKRRLFEEAKRNDIMDRGQILAHGRGSLNDVMKAPQLRPPADMGPGVLKSLGNHAGLIGGGALVGAGFGALSGANRSKSQTKRLQQGGPIQRWMAEHPVASSAGLGGAATGAGFAGGVAAPAIARKLGLGSLSGLAELPGFLAGSMAPGLATMGLDSVLKKREDAAAAKTAAARFRSGLRKLGFGAQGMPEPGAGTDPGAAPMPDQQNAVMPQPSMAAPGPQPPMATEPGAQRYTGVNYLEAEETARRAQQQNETGFYRDQAQQAQQSAASMGQQVQQIQQQLDQLSAQAGESQNQIMAANQEAQTANDNMLNQATLAARMRMGMQQLRAQMMEIASQDPEQLAAAAGGPTPMDVGNQAQMAQAGAAPPGGDPAAAAAGGMGDGQPAVDPATGQPLQEPGAQPGTPDGATPDAAAQGGSVPSGAGGSEDKSAPEPKAEPKKDGGETTVSIKKASARLKLAGTLGQEFMGKLPYMAIGAGAGAISAVHQGTKVKGLREQVDELKGQQDGGFGKTLELAKAHMALAQAEDAKQRPFRSALAGGLSGAGLGAAVGAAVPYGIAGGQRLAKNIKTIRGNL